MHKLLAFSVASLVTLSLPAPTGTAAIGTHVLALVDSTRADPETHNRFGGRPIAVQFWYPSRSRGRDAMPYLVERGLADSLIRDGYADTAVIRAWDRLPTHATRDAAVAPGSHPLIALSSGLGEPRAVMTSIAEDLASHGYIVALFDHPHDGYMILPDGFVASTADDATQWNDPAYIARQMNESAADIALLIERMRASTTDAMTGELTRAVDWSLVGAVGHSSGGLAAIEACAHIPRMRACVDLDGGLTDPTGQPMADVVKTGVTKPTLFIRSHPLYSDADLARLHRTREQWEALGRIIRGSIDSLGRRSSAPILEATVDGTGHLSFTDAPFLQPDAITRFGGRIIDKQRGYHIITTLIRAYFDQQFGIRSTASFAQAANFPEVAVRQIGTRP